MKKFFSDFFCIKGGYDFFMITLRMQETFLIAIFS